MSKNVIISTAHARYSRVDYLLAEPLIMVSRPTVDPYVGATDPTVADKRRRLGYGTEPEGCPRVGEYMHLQWYEDKKCYPCRVVYYHPGKDNTTVIYGEREQYAIELVSMSNRAWHYFSTPPRASAMKIHTTPLPTLAASYSSKTSP